MKLHRYLSRLHAAVLSRSEIIIEKLRYRCTAVDIGTIHGILRFYDGSRLIFDEEVRLTKGRLVKGDYRYHYQDAAGNLIFRYDNAPHHREVSTFPHHKHTPEGIVPSEMPDLVEILREIDGLLYQR